MTSSAGRSRALSMGLVLGFLAATHLSVPEPQERAEWQYRIVIALGWGHLLAGLGRRSGRGAWRARALGLCACGWLFALYAALLLRWPALVLGPLAISTWHTVENEQALGRAARGGLALPPLPRTLRAHLPALGATSLVGVLALGTEEGAALLQLGGGAAGAWPLLARGVCLASGIALQRAGGATARAAPLLVFGAVLPRTCWSDWLRLPDLFVLVTLQHLLAWLLRAFSHIRVEARPIGCRGVRPILLWLLLTHLPPMLLCGALAAAPAPGLDPLRTLVLAPAVYLFWAALHVVQTAWARGLEPGRAHGASRR